MEVPMSQATITMAIDNGNGRIEHVDVAVVDFDSENGIVNITTAGSTSSILDAPTTLTLTPGSTSSILD
jgi:hypothetical protein